jgi:hypothetical protein
MFAATFLSEILFDDKQIRMTNVILGMLYDGTYILLLRSFDIIKFKFYSWEISTFSTAAYKKYMGENDLMKNFSLLVPCFVWCFMFSKFNASFGCRVAEKNSHHSKLLLNLME